MTRQLVQPVLIQAVGLTSVGLFPTTPAAGIDAAGTGGNSFATAWTGIQGIEFINTGLCFVWFYCGATPAGAINILQGEKVAGQLPPASTFGGTISASTYGWIPNLSPSAFNQQDQNAYSGSSAPGGTSLGGGIGATGQGLTCIDFTTTTTLAVRVYQIAQLT